MTIITSVKNEQQKPTFAPNPPVFIPKEEGALDGFDARDQKCELVSAMANTWDIAPHSVMELGGGDNDVFKVNDTWIFRLPKDEKAKCANRREQALLAVLSRRMRATSIPNYTFWDESRGAGAYKEIAGHSLSRFYFQRFSEADQAQLADSCALALSEIHATSLEEIPVRLDMVSRERKIDFDDLKKALLDKTIFSTEELEKISCALLRVEKFLGESRFTSVLLHGDLHCENVIVDGKEKKLSGIIDFSDAIIGPAVLDLVGFYRMGIPFAERLQEKYADAMKMDFLELRAICRAWAMVSFARVVVGHTHADSPRHIRRLTRAGQVMGWLFALEN